MKTSELAGAALDWAVAKCEARNVETENGLVTWPYLTGYSPSTIWEQGGPIIDRLMDECRTFCLENDKGYAHHCYLGYTEHDNHHGFGPTPLIAAMRCYVASKLGDEVDVPEELK